MRRWDSLVDQYIAEVRTRGLSEATIKSYLWELQKVGNWLKRRKPKPNLENVDGELLIGYIRSRTAFHARATVAGVLTSLRMMGAFLVYKGIWQSNPMRWIKGPKLDPRMRLPRRIGRTQMEKIWNQIANVPQVSSRRRLLCLLSILYGTGLRRGELERLNIQDWNREEGTLTIDGHKTGRQRKVPVWEGIWGCVEGYLPHRHNTLEKLGRIEEKAFFVNRHGERLMGHSISKMIHRLARRADVPLVSVHQFRHSCASDLLESGVRLHEVKEFLGHAAIETTMRYTHVSGSQRSEAISKHPVNEFLSENLAAERKVS